MELWCCKDIGAQRGEAADPRSHSKLVTILSASQTLSLSVFVTSLPSRFRACTWPARASSDAWSQPDTRVCVLTWPRHSRAGQWSGPSGSRAPLWLRMTPTWMKARESVSRGWWLTGRQGSERPSHLSVSPENEWALMSYCVAREVKGPAQWVKRKQSLDPRGAHGLHYEQMQIGLGDPRQQVGRRYRCQRKGRTVCCLDNKGAT